MSRVEIAVERSGYVLLYARDGIACRVPLSRSRAEAELLAEAVAVTLDLEPA